MNEVDAHVLVRQRRGRILKFVRRPGGLMFGLGALILIGVAVVGLLAPHLPIADPGTMDFLTRLAPPTWLSGGGEHAFGTDALGRDVFARVVYGVRVSFPVGLWAVLGAGALGLILGMISGYMGGVVDTLVMRMLDIQMSLPPLALAVALAAVIGPSLRNLVFVLIITGWPLFARVARAQTLLLKDHLYVQAAISIGAPDVYVLIRHILPNLVSEVIVTASFSFAYMITTEASLTFLGLGADPLLPSWGAMLSEGQAYMDTAWWNSVFPGVALAVTVLGANLLGNGLRSLLDPRAAARGAL